MMTRKRMIGLGHKFHKQLFGAFSTPAVPIHVSLDSLQEAAEDNQITCSEWGKIIKSNMS